MMAPLQSQPIKCLLSILGCGVHSVEVRYRVVEDRRSCSHYCSTHTVKSLGVKRELPRSHQKLTVAAVREPQLQQFFSYQLAHLPFKLRPREAIGLVSVCEKLAGDCHVPQQISTDVGDISADGCLVLLGQRPITVLGEGHVGEAREDCEHCCADLHPIGCRWVANRDRDSHTLVRNTTGDA